MRSKPWAFACLLALQFQIQSAGAVVSGVPFPVSSATVHGHDVRTTTQPQSAPSASSQSPNEAAAAEILEKYIAAIGGRDLWHSSRNVEEVIEQEVFGSVNKVYTIRETAPPRRFYTRAEGPNGTSETGFDGKRLWQKNAFFRGYLSESDPQFRNALRQSTQVSLVDYKDSQKKYTRLPNETVEGKEYLVIASTQTGPLGQEAPIRMYFDPATYLLRRTVIGDQIKTTADADDYRIVEGRKVAFKQVTHNPQATATRTVKSIKYNVAVDDSRFEFDGQSAIAKNKSTASEAPAKSVDASSKPAEAVTKTEKNTDLRPLKTFAADEIMPEDTRNETFEFVWKTVNDTYWDKTFNGVNWQAVHDKYAPLVKAEQKSGSFHQLLERMIGELNESHFRIVPPDRVRTPGGRTDDLQNGAVGLDLRWIDKQLLVIDLKKDYPAQAAGMRKGFVITKIDGQTPNELYDDFLKKNPGFHVSENLLRARAAGQALAGKPDTAVKLEVRNGEDKLVEMELKRKAVPIGGSPLEFESRKLDNNVGYVAINVFFGEAVSRFQAALREFRDTRALIIDLRGNPGGVGRMAPTMAESLFSEPGSLGVSRFRYETQQFAYKGSGKDAYKGKVVILVDDGSASTSEVFSGGLQENGRATIVGSTTAGAVLPSVQSFLPSGGVLQHPVSDFKTPKGVVLEGHGVIPDIEAHPSRSALLGGHDPALERALEFIQNARQ